MKRVLLLLILLVFLNSLVNPISAKIKEKELGFFDKLSIEVYCFFDSCEKEENTTPIKTEKNKEINNYYNDDNQNDNYNNNDYKNDSDKNNNVNNNKINEEKKKEEKPKVIYKDRVIYQDRVVRVKEKSQPQVIYKTQTIEKQPIIKQEVVEKKIVEEYDDSRLKRDIRMNRKLIGQLNEITQDTLEDLYDTDINENGLLGNEVLTWDSALKKWIAKDRSLEGDFEDLQVRGKLKDKDGDAGTENQILVADADGKINWVDQLILGLDKALAVDTNKILSVLYDSSTITVNSNNELSVKDGGISSNKLANNSVTKEKLANDALNETSIDKLSDVDTTTNTPTNGQILAWDGSNWVPKNTSDLETTTNISDTVTGHKIAKYTNEDGTNQDINETITKLEQNTDGTLTYTDENGDETTVSAKTFVEGKDDISVSGTGSQTDPYKVSFTETHTSIDDLTSGHLIGTFKNENNDEYKINETVTSLALNTNSLDYKDENGDTTNIDLGKYLDNTDDQKIDKFELSGDNLLLSLENDGEADKTVDLSKYALDTDLHNKVTLTGSLDYLTLNNQEITLNTIDISDDTNLSAGTGLKLNGDQILLDAVLSNLSDVSTSSVSTGDLLKWDGSNWVNIAATDYLSNIYNSDGKITSNRTVDLNGNNLIFDGSGNVGIGTSNPSHKLQVSGNVRASKFLAANGTAGSPAFKFDEDLDTGILRPEANNLAVTTGGDERLRIDENGNVGIGTTDPSQKLHISGNARLEGALYDKNNEAGNDGQILKSTADGVEWIDQFITSIKTNVALKITNQALELLFDDTTLGVNSDNKLYIKDSGVGNNQLADNAVTSEKIKDGEVKTDDIADSNVTSGKIADKAITNIKLDDDSVDSRNYIDASIDDEHINWGTNDKQVSAKDVPVADEGNYYPDNNVEDVLQHLGLNATERWSTGLTNGGEISDAGDNKVDISAGKGFVNNDTDKLKRVSWSDLSGISLPYEGDNFIYINSDGDLDIKNTQASISDYIYLGYAYTTNGNTDIGMLSSNPFHAGNYTAKSNNWFEKVVGPMIEDGNLVSEGSDALSLTVNSGKINSRLSEYNTSDTDTFTKWYKNGSDWVIDSSDENKANTTKYNDVNNGLVDLDDNYWKKDLILRTLDGNVHYIYGQSQYDNEDDAKKAPLPVIPDSIQKAGAVYLATIVSQKNDTSVADNLYDIRPNMDRLFGYGTNGTVGSVADHGDLIGLGDDDHPQYLLVAGSRAMSGNLDLGNNSIENIKNLTLAGLLKNETTDTPQVQIGYDDSNYFTTEVKDDGKVVFDTYGSNQKFEFIDPVILSSDLVVSGNVLSDDVIKLGDADTDTLTVNAVLQNEIPLVFEGATEDSFETSFKITDPTEDRTITFPDLSGTVATQTNDLTEGSIVFADSNGQLAENNSKFYWDNDNEKLGLGTDSPTQLLHIAGNARLEGALYDKNNEAGNDGQILSSTTDGTDWITISDISLGSIDKHSDVDTSTNAPTDKQVLSWDGSNWVPKNTSDLETTTNISDTVTGHKIAKYTNEDGTEQNISETITSLSLNTNSLDYKDENGDTTNIDLGKYLDNTDDQKIDEFSLSNGVLSLSLEDDGEATKTLDFSGLYSVNNPLSLADRKISLNYDDSTIGIDTNNKLIVKENGITNTQLANDAVKTENILNGTILEEDLSSTNDPTDNYVLTYDDTSKGFTWEDASSLEKDTLDTVADRGATTDQSITTGGFNTTGSSSFADTQISGVFKDKDGDTGADGQILVADGGKLNWVDKFISSVNDAGAEVVNGVLKILFDDSTIGVNGSNELEVKDNGINSAKIADGSIGTADLSDGAITTAKVADNAITLGTKTTGDYLSDITAGTGISISGSGSEGANPTVSLNASIDNLTDVDTSTNAPTNGQVLAWDGNNWVPSRNEKDNIYTADGTLTGDRNLSLDSHNLAFDTDKFFIDGSSGNVGIGVTSPSNKLDVNGDILATGGNIFLQSNDNGIYVDQSSGTEMRFSLAGNNIATLFRIGDDTSQFRLSQYSSGNTADNYPAYSFSNDNDSGLLLFDDNQIGLATGGDTKLLVDDQGNVGIGTTNPNDRLEILSDDDSALRIRTTATDKSAYIQLGTDSSNRGSIGYIDNDSIFRIGVASNVGGPTMLRDYTRLAITSSGDIGIGVDDPTQKLHIAGNARLEGALYDNNNSAGNQGQVLTSTGSGIEWKNPNSVPYISKITPIAIKPGETKTITIEGSKFIPNSAVAISGGNTVNSVTVISPEKIQVEVEATNTQGDYDIVISNNGILNTEWTNNGVGILHVTDRDGTAQDKAGETCKGILDNGFSTGDGTYWIDPNGGNTDDAFQVYCDMTTDGGGWTKVPYHSDLAYKNHGDGSGDDKWLWLDTDFSLDLTDQQINDIRSKSTEGKQLYRGKCAGVIHHLYLTGMSYGSSFGFRFQNGDETNHGAQKYDTNIEVPYDGCAENNNGLNYTDFIIKDIRVPVINVYSQDNGQSDEKFGSDLKHHPAWLR